jgi:hypothetical protein
MSDSACYQQLTADVNVGCSFVRISISIVRRHIKPYESWPSSAAKSVDVTMPVIVRPFDLARTYPNCSIVGKASNSEASESMTCASTRQSAALARGRSASHQSTFASSIRLLDRDSRNHDITASANEMLCFGSLRIDLRTSAMERDGVSDIVRRGPYRVVELSQLHKSAIADDSQ